MSVYRALQATRFLPSLASAAPYTLSRSFIKFSRFGLLWAFIQLSGYAVHLYINSKQIPMKSVNVETFLLASASWLQLLIGVYSFLKDALCQKNIIAVVRSMDRYDKRSDYTNEKNRQRENERVRLWSFAYSAVLVAATLGRYLVRRTIAYFIVMEMATLQVNNGIYMFVVLTTLLGRRLRHLKSIVDQTRVTIVLEKGAAPESSDPANPEYLRELYTSLHAIGERLNDHYSDRLFLWSAQAIMLFVLRIYFLITVKVSTIFVVATIVHLLSVAVGLLLYCTACQFTVDQAKKIVSALLEKNIRHTAGINRGRREIFTMSLYMALRPLEFSALGFFSVDFSLIYTIFAATVSYVALSLQARTGA